MHAAPQLCPVVGLEQRDRAPPPDGYGVTVAKMAGVDVPVIPSPGVMLAVRGYFSRMLTERGESKPEPAVAAKSSGKP